ncbi:predicted protein [Nematostella vectensis]|uniref:Uncharacterized protein n=1 Tax=Nematostella vectensis TaxID=45351 RepID=A7RKZ7_NEMVE|nr:predicted protein [Nematostella vectensis]|eukprot:XP_001639833.1 predicted protein [Nematostella vectensis]
MRRSSVDQWFHSAKKGKDADLTKLIEKRKAWDVDIRDVKFRSALFLAAKAGKVAAVEQLLNHGAEPNRHSRFGTPAHAAAEEGHEECFRLLISRGAQLDLRNHQGVTVLECAKEAWGTPKTNRIIKSAEEIKFDALKKRKASVSSEQDSPDHGKTDQSIETCGQEEAKHGGQWRSSPESQQSGCLSESEEESQEISSCETKNRYDVDYGSQDMPMEAVNIAKAGPSDNYSLNIQNKGNLVVQLGDDREHTFQRQLAVPMKRRNNFHGSNTKILRLRIRNSSQIVGATSKKRKRREVLGYKKGGQLDKNSSTKNVYIDIKDNSGPIQISNGSCNINKYNINIVNSSGNVVIGDNAKCEHNFVTGENVTADGSHPNMVVSPTSPLVVRAGKSLAKRTQLIYTLIGDIYPLRENGKWDLFYQSINQRLKIVRNAGQRDVQIFLMIEKSIGLRYQKKNEDALNLLNKANKKISEHALELREFLLALSHTELAALYRREGKKLKTYDALAKAQQNAEMVPSFLVKGFTAYERASTLVKELSLVSYLEPDRDEIKKETKDALRLVISFCEKMLQQNPDIYLRKHIFALLLLAHLDLNCRTSVARSQPVCEGDVKEAED